MLLAVHKPILFSQTITPTAVEAYLFYNLYIFDPFGPPLQLRLPQCVQIVQIQTHETWKRLEEEHFKKGYKGSLCRTFTHSKKAISNDIITNFTCLQFMKKKNLMIKVKLYYTSKCTFKLLLKYSTGCDVQGETILMNWNWQLMAYIAFTDRLSSRMGWIFLPNPSFPCRRSANSPQISFSPSLSGRCCCRSVNNALVMSCDFFGETWLAPKVYRFLSSCVSNAWKTLVCSRIRVFKLSSTVLKHVSELKKKSNSLAGIKNFSRASCRSKSHQSSDNGNAVAN